MEEFVHDYLSMYYKVEASKVGNDGIYTIEPEEGIIYPMPVYGDRLIKELVLIFYEDEVSLKRYINKWAKSKNTKINLKFFWQQKEPWFPQVRQVSTQLLANDIVAVQPMNGPTGTLMYLDYVYSGNTPNRNCRVYDQEIMNIEVDRINAHAAVLLGELDHPSPPIFVSSRGIDTEEIERQSWFNPTEE